MPGAFPFPFCSPDMFFRYDQGIEEVGLDDAAHFLPSVLLYSGRQARNGSYLGNDATCPMVD
jgi:hypothetical protein